MTSRLAPAPDEALLTTEQLAGLLQTHVNTVRRYQDQGLIPVAAWVGTRARFSRQDVLAALSQRGPAKQAPQDAPGSTRPPIRRGRIGKRPQVQP